MKKDQGMGKYPSDFRQNRGGRNAPNAGTIKEEIQFFAIWILFVAYSTFINSPRQFGIYFDRFAIRVYLYIHLHTYIHTQTRTK